MNKILLSTIALVALTNSCFADDLSAKVDQLQKEVNDLKSQKVETNKWIGDVETLASVGSKIRFGLDFDTKMDNFVNKTQDGKSYQDNNVFSNKLNLNIYAPISDDLKFTGRLTGYKYWANSYVHPYSNYDSMQGRVPSDSSIYLERAYIDWKAYNGDTPVILTLGRQPSSEGLGTELSRDGVRGGTYSALAFDGAADGIVATVDISKYVDKTAFRLAYGKGYQTSNTNGMASNAFSGTGQGAIKDNQVVGAFIDTAFPIENKSIVQLGYVKAIDISANSQDTTNNVNIGDLSLYGVSAGVFDVSNFDFYAHLWFSEATPNGVMYNGPMGLQGLLTNTAGDTSTKHGYAIWLESRYKLPTTSKNYIGVEYNHGSENWLNMTQGSTDPINKLATRGDAYEAYFIHEISRYASFKVGAIVVNDKYTGSGWQIGAPMNVSDVPAPMSSGVVKQTIDYYAQFSVSF